MRWELLLIIVAGAWIGNVYTEHTQIPKKKLVELLKHDLWLTPETCIKYGLVDAVYDVSVF